MVTCCFFFNDTATTEIYTLSLHDALPIYQRLRVRVVDAEHLHAVVDPVLHDAADLRRQAAHVVVEVERVDVLVLDRKSTRLNSSHANISYAVFCLKKKKTQPLRSTGSGPP